MAYTPFVLLAAVIIISMAFTATNSVHQDTFSQEYVNSIEESWEITQTSYAINSADILAEKTQSNEVENFGEAAENLTFNGTYQGVEETDNNYLNWSEKVVEISSKIENTGLSNLNISSNNLSVITKSRFKLVLNNGNYTLATENKRKISGVTDPMLENIETREMNACTHTKLARKHSTGDDYNGTARGKPIIEPSDASAGESVEILVASQITNYTASNVQQYAGYVTEEDFGSPGNYNDNYVIGVESLPEFSKDQRVLIHEGFWKSNFFRTRDNECYLPTAFEDAPGISDRIENKTRGSDPEGIFTVLDSPYTGGESDIGYERVNSSGITPKEVSGVSAGEGEVWSKFRMGENLISELGLDELAD